MAASNLDRVGSIDHWKIARYHTPILVISILLAYSSALSAGFVFDDIPAIVENPSIRTLWPPWSVMFGPLDILRPLVGLSLAFNYAIGGLSPFTYHLFNLAIHTLAGLTLLLTVRSTLQLSKSDPLFRDSADTLSFCIALLWSLHPLQTMAVTYTIQRAESMMGLFFLLCLYCYIRFRNSSAKMESLLYGLACWLACLCGMASKQVMVAVIPSVLLYEYLYFSKSLRDSIKTCALLWIGLLLTLLIPVLTIRAATKLTNAGFSGTGIDPWHYLLTQAEVLWHYLRLVFYPYPQSVDYGWPIVEDWREVWLPGSVILIFVFIAIIGAVKLRLWALPALAFFIILAPTSSFMPIADACVEHRMYLPLACVVTGVVLIAYRTLTCLLKSRPDRVENYIMLACVLLTLLLGTLTFMRNQVYRSPLELWLSVIRVCPDHYRGYYNLGAHLIQKGEYDVALAYLNEALKRKPEHLETRYNRAKLYTQQSRLQDALADYARILERDPDYVSALANRANLYIRLGQYTAALSDLDRALDRAPELKALRSNRAVAYFYLQRYREALADLECMRQANLPMPDGLMEKVEKALSE